MTRTTNARIAGITFLVYIADGLTHMALSRQAMGGQGIAARFARMAQHTTEVRVVVLLGLIECFCALVLAVTLWSITRDEDRDLAMLGMICRVAEGLLGALSIPDTLAALWLATANGANAPDKTAAHAIGAYLFQGDVSFTGLFFAVGSTLFAWLLLRGRMIPVVLAWIGVIASLLLVIVLPLQLAGFVSGPITAIVWLPMLAYEVPLALWLIFKGVDIHAVPGRAEVH